MRKYRTKREQKVYENYLDKAYNPNYEITLQGKRLYKKIKHLPKTFKSLKEANKYALKTGMKIYNNTEGYLNRRRGHLIVK